MFDPQNDKVTNQNKQTEVTQNEINYLFVQRDIFSKTYAKSKCCTNLVIISVTFSLSISFSFLQLDKDQTIQKLVNGCFCFVTIGFCISVSLMCPSTKSDS